MTDSDSRIGENSAAYRRLRNTLGIFVVLILLLVISVVFSISRTRSKELAPPNGATSGDGAAIPPRRGSQSIPSDMVYVQGGSFTMGNDTGDEYEKPSHRVTLKPFLVDIHEVTLADYRSFINATGRQPPSSWKDPAFLPGSERRPVTGVDWYDAAAYAAWAGKRLPTEEEWEFAARGFDQRKYPWGNDWHSGMANAGDSTAGDVVDVGSYPEGRSPFGAIDMIGNAWEWTASDLRQYPGSQAKLPNGVRKIIRGGSWALDDPPDWTTTFRGFAVPAGGKDYSKIGFRCARDVETP